MADPIKPKKLLSGLVKSISAASKAATKMMLGEIDINPQMGGMPTFDADYVGIEMLLGSSLHPSRSRSAIYTKWHQMIQDGLISTILRLHVQMALGGHETTGETVFIEAKPAATPAEVKLVEELQEIAAILNKSAHSICFNACAFGDSYGRVMTTKGVGLTHLETEIVFPPLVQAYEEMGRTVGYIVALGPKMTCRFSHLDMVRMKMPRMVFLPQMRAIENAQKINLEAKTVNESLPLPAMTGGSFLEACEDDYDNLRACLRGLVGQRIAGSIDETMIGANLSDMTIQQQESFMRGIEAMLSSMKTRAEEQVASGQYATSRNFHILPTFGDKQLTQISSFQGTSTSGTGVGIEDVMFFARKLAGTAGIDLSMVGFADQLTGGLGEGGFNSTSSQAAERSRIIRTAFMTMANDVIDRHMLAKYGFCWSDAERPYSINFYGSIAALEAQKQASRERSINTSAILVTVLAQLRDLGMDEKTNEQVLVKAELDDDFAKQLANGIANAKPPAVPVGGGGGFGEPEPADNSNDEEAA